VLFWRYLYLFGAGALTILLAMAPGFYRAACPGCMLDAGVFWVQMGAYAAAILMGVWVSIAAWNINRRVFWWLAAPPYVLVGSLAGAMAVMSVMTLLVT
jgi:hypothetical protein